MAEQSSPEEVWIAAFEELLAEFDALEDALSAVNDLALRDRVEQLLAHKPLIAAAHQHAPGRDVADALLGLRSAAQALPVPARDPELGATQTLRRLREAKGLIIAAIEDVLKAAAGLGRQPLRMDPPREISRGERAAEIHILTVRLEQVVGNLDALDAARLDQPGFAQQSALLDAYIPPMRVEVDLARLHLTIGDASVDLGAFARAIEAMGELTRGFTATVTAWVRRVSDSLTKGASAIRTSVTELLDFVRATERMVREANQQPETFAFPVPEMVMIPPGVFMMGIPDDQVQDDWDRHSQPVHEVRIAQAFWMGKYPVTRGEYAAFVAATGYDRDNGVWHNTSFAQSDRDPVVNVSVADAEAYAAWLSRETKRDYRLPSEAQWEYACRAGTTGPIPTQPGETLGDIAWYGANSGQRTHPVGEKSANFWGLHDMLGNVWEWCADAWSDDYRRAPVDGSARKADGPAARVVRGGCWNGDARGVRASFRLRFVPSHRFDRSGFRLARVRERGAERPAEPDSVQ